MPAASTRISTPPKRLTAASTTLSQLAAELSAMGCDLLGGSGPAGGRRRVAAGPRQHLGGQRPERTRCPGYDGGLAANVEQRERIFEEVFGHGELPNSAFRLPLPLAGE